MSDPFFKVKNLDEKRPTKKNTATEKYKRNGKYTSRGMRAKQEILLSSQRANNDLSINAPRETVVGTVLNRDKTQSIMLPPTLQKDPKLHVVRKKAPKPKLNTEERYNIDNIDPSDIDDDLQMVRGV